MFIVDWYRRWYKSNFEKGKEKVRVKKEKIANVEPKPVGKVARSCDIVIRTTLSHCDKPLVKVTGPVSGLSDTGLPEFSEASGSDKSVRKVVVPSFDDPVTRTPTPTPPTPTPPTPTPPTPTPPTTTPPTTTPPTTDLTSISSEKLPGAASTAPKSSRTTANLAQLSPDQRKETEPRQLCRSEWLKQPEHVQYTKISTKEMDKIFSKSGHWNDSVKKHWKERSAQARLKMVALNCTNNNTTA